MRAYGEDGENWEDRFLGILIFFNKNLKNEKIMQTERERGKRKDWGRIRKNKKG